MSNGGMYEKADNIVSGAIFLAFVIPVLLFIKCVNCIDPEGARMMRIDEAGFESRYKENSDRVLRGIEMQERGEWYEPSGESTVEDTVEPEVEIVKELPPANDDYWKINDNGKRVSILVLADKWFRIEYNRKEARRKIEHFREKNKMLDEDVRRFKREIMRNSKSRRNRSYIFRERSSNSKAILEWTEIYEGCTKGVADIDAIMRIHREKLAEVGVRRIYGKWVIKE